MLIKHHYIEMNHSSLPMWFAEITLTFITMTMKECNSRKKNSLKTILHMMQNLNDGHVFQRQQSSFHKHLFIHVAQITCLYIQGTMQGFGVDRKEYTTQLLSTSNYLQNQTSDKNVHLSLFSTSHHRQTSRKRATPWRTSLVKWKRRKRNNNASSMSCQPRRLVYTQNQVSGRTQPTRREPMNERRASTCEHLLNTHHLSHTCPFIIRHSFSFLLGNGKKDDYKL